ncbi:Maf family protein [Candidatus Dependentiae bacterium]|nr:Maf family protein [Candidatus Dependentiae bacterium]
MKKNTLYLGSKSLSRQELLKQAHISFTLVNQDVNESVCDWNLSLPEVVQNIAIYKMQHTILPDGDDEGDICFVLTADTLSQDPNGSIAGKPKDRADAIRMLRQAQEGYMKTGTAFCLDKKIWHEGKWHKHERIIEYVEGRYIFNVPNNWIDTYLDTSDRYSMSSGALTIEEYGILFFKEVQGSFTAVVGLPMYELRQALEKIGFFL